MKPRLILNIGFAKTGTSWWQARVFPKLDLNYLGRDYTFKRSWNPFGKSPLLHSVACHPAVQDLVDYLSLGGDCQYSEDVLKALAGILTDGRVNMISHENILRPFSYDSLPSRLLELEKICDLTILIFTRKQSDIILSRHMHDVRTKKFLGKSPEIQFADSPKESCRWPYCQNARACPCKQLGKNIINADYYNYDSLLARLKEQLPNANFVVYPLEELHSGSLESVRKLSGDLKVDLLPNEGIDFGKINTAGNKREFLNRYPEVEEVISKFTNSYYS